MLEGGKPSGLTIAIRLTALGATLCMTAATALLAADVVSQFDPRHAALLFGLSGGSVALVVWRGLWRFFRSFDGF